MKTLGRYVLNVLLALDRLGNALWGGTSKETVSSHLGRLQREYGGDIPFEKRPIPAVGSDLLDAVDKNHCQDAIEHDEMDHIKHDSVIDGEKGTDK